MQVLRSIGFSISFFLAFTLLSKAQDAQQPPLAMVLMEMSTHNRFESSTIGFAAQKSKQYQRYEQLVAIATNEQLLDIAMNHKNGVVRLYAFQALQQKKTDLPSALVQQFKNDQTIITVFRGCVMDKKPISHITTGGMAVHNLSFPTTGNFH